MAADLVKGVIDYSANVIFGACIDENMSDEVEVVIIATGFNNQQNGITPEAQDSALRQATLLSQKIDFAYNDRNTGFVPQEPAQYVSYAVPQENTFGQPIPQYASVYPTQPTAQPVTPQNAYPPVYPTQAPVAQPTPNEAFEPGDPIPEQKSEETVDRKHRPRFVDYFMKKNNNDW